MIVNVTDITIEETRAQIACMLNELWHSVLPKIHWSNVVRPGRYACYVFKYKEAIIGVAIWSRAVAGNRFTNEHEILELRRLALSNVCPKNTATYAIAKMIKLLKIKFPVVKRLISYQDKEVHNGTIYKAANWIKTSEAPLIPWSNKRRKRNKLQSNSAKIRWEYKI
jgi:hypothetical protein